MEELLPWKELERPIARYYSKSLRGRKPYPLSVMLRIHLVSDQKGSYYTSRAIEFDTGSRLENILCIMSHCRETQTSLVGQTSLH